MHRQERIEALEQELSGRRLDLVDYVLLAETVANLTETVATMHAELDTSIDSTWILAAGLICFFMQAGFGMLEAGRSAQKIPRKS